MLIDTPGLSETIVLSSDKKYLEDIRENVGYIDCMWYVARLDDTRLRRDDQAAIQLTIAAFGKEVWNKALLVFTHADKLNPEDYSLFYSERAELFRSYISESIGATANTEEKTNDSKDQAKTTDDAFAFITKELQIIYNQTRAQSQVCFGFNLCADILGFIAIVIGILFMLFGGRTEGLVTLLSSVIPGVAAGLFFKQSQAANERIDAIRSKLDESRKLQTAIEIARTIVDSAAQDRLKSEIVRRVLSIYANASKAHYSYARRCIMPFMRQLFEAGVKRRLKPGSPGQS